MAVRRLYLVRHGHADAFGELTEARRAQCRLLGERLAHIALDAVWHSPLPRAAASAQEIARSLPGVFVAAADELVDHVPFVPEPAETPPSWRGFFDGYDRDEADAGRRTADALVARFLSTQPAPMSDTRELLVTHAYPIAWLVRHALGAPPERWLGLNSASTALTVVELRGGQPPTLVMFNDLSHLPAELRWTGFPGDPPP